MPRPALEVADIFRRHGPAYRETHGAALSRAQRRGMAAIEACRTAALGGHVEACDRCGHRAPAYNSCLMGSGYLWGVGLRKSDCYGDFPQVSLPIKLRS
jgi:hypothetical protein